jgi:predicted MarR family transcription regulator
MAKKKIEYAPDDTPEERDRDMRIRDILGKLNVGEFLYAEYSTTYKKLMKNKNMTATKAHALATCELVRKNNATLLNLLVEYGFQFPD